MKFAYVNLPPYAGTGQHLRRRVGLGRGGQRQRRARGQGRGLEIHRLHGPAGQCSRWNLATYTLPSLKALENDPRSWKSAPLLKAAFNVLPYGRWVGPVHNRDRFWQSIHDSFTAACLGQLDAATALTQAEQEINAMIDEFGRGP